ncbi:hypothetical protein OFN71_30060, partial [Escherichia coli]|nr:hypothetical protein [Escherichia coli]
NLTLTLGALLIALDIELVMLLMSAHYLLSIQSLLLMVVQGISVHILWAANLMFELRWLKLAGLGRIRVSCLVALLILVHLVNP